MTKGWFITGTDTGVGKTRVAVALLQAAVATGKRVVGMKPVASGCRHTPLGLRNDDAQALSQAANVLAAYDEVNPYAFAPAISPHLAAAEAGVAIDIESIRARFARLAARADYAVVEGAGGWLAPLDATRSMADLACALRLPVILVVGMRLGCLNHALLTYAAIAPSDLRFAGWVANCIEPSMERLDENLATLTNRLGVAPLAVLPHATVAHVQATAEQLKSALFKSD